MNLFLAKPKPIDYQWKGMVSNILAKPKPIDYQWKGMVSNILAKLKPINYQWKVWHIIFWQNLNLSIISGR